MNAKCRIASAGLVFLFCAACCASQGTGDKHSEFVAHAQKAASYLRDERPDLAIPELQAAVAIDPDDVETQGNLGVLLFFQGRSAEAIPHFRAALKKQSGLAKIQGLLGIAEAGTSDLADARKDLEASLPLIQSKEFKIQVGLKLVELDTETSDLDAAAVVIAQLRKAYPENAEVLYAAHRTYSDLAGESMLMLTLAAPDSAQMQQLLAHENIRQGNTNGAIAHYRSAIQIDPHLPGVHFELAELLHTSLDERVKQDAEREYRLALAANPRDERAVCRLAEIAAGRGDIAKAYEEYSTAVALRPEDTDAALGLAKTLIEMNQPERALTLLEKSVQLEPTNAMAHYRLGTLYRKIGREQDAKREVELYKKYKGMKDKLGGIYKELQIQPSEIQDDEPAEK
jgi:Tfp pilus assembly protein PilF